MFPAVLHSMNKQLFIFIAQSSVSIRISFEASAQTALYTSQFIQKNILFKRVTFDLKEYK
jgi:hypothetical protein